ncbi:hypothetical protein [Amycolatopsis magusensis]|uniref:hypothetical protein n=1 Tax=Amycolatopsis magusensis TaxID=882444 RepID=UPI003C2B5C2A
MDISCVVCRAFGTAGEVAFEPVTGVGHAVPLGRPDLPHSGDRRDLAWWLG